MKRTLNLTIDETVIKKAKEYARRRGTSVSRIVEEELDRRTREVYSEPRSDSITARLSGSMTLSDHGKSVDDLLTEALRKNVGLDSD